MEDVGEDDERYEITAYLRKEFEVVGPSTRLGTLATLMTTASGGLARSW